MKAKKILLFGMIGVMLLGTISCSSNNKSTIEQGVKVGLPKDAKVNKITITYFGGFQEIVESAILLYNQKYSDVKIEGTDLPSSSLKEYKLKLATEILTGEGPDILYYQPGYFDSIHKVIESGALYDLNQLISKDTEFKVSDYNEDILDYGVLDGKRYFIPLSYSRLLFATSNKVLEKNNIKVEDSGWTWEELHKAVKKFMASNKNRNLDFFDSYFNFDAILGSYPKSFVDYKEKKSLFDCKEFKQLLRIYKDIFPAVENENRDSKYDNAKIIEAVSKNEVILLTDIFLDPCNFSFANAEFLKAFGEEIKCMPLPYIDNNDKFVPSLYSLVSINAKCKEKAAAFNFIKILLSKELQSTAYRYSQRMGGYFLGMPVRNEAFNDDFLYFATNNKYDPDFSEKLKSQFLDLTHNIKKVELTDSQIYKIVNDAVRKYVSNTSTEDQTIKEINNKVELFLNE